MQGDGRKASYDDADYVIDGPNKEFLIVKESYSQQKQANLISIDRSRFRQYTILKAESLTLIYPIDIRKVGAIHNQLRSNSYQVYR